MSECGKVEKGFTLFLKLKFDLITISILEII